MRSRNTASVHQKHPPASTATSSAIDRSFSVRADEIGPISGALKGLGLVARFEACKLEPLADPFGKLLECQLLVEDDSRPAVGEPAYLPAYRPKALDHHDDVLADAIFLDRLDL